MLPNGLESYDCPFLISSRCFQNTTLVFALPNICTYILGKGYFKTENSLNISLVEQKHTYFRYYFSNLPTLIDFMKKKKRYIYKSPSTLVHRTEHVQWKGFPFMDSPISFIHRVKEFMGSLKNST